MATDFRVVTPDDMGNTIRLGAKEPNKYDVDVSQLNLPASVTGVTLQGTVLAVQTPDGDKTVDLAPMLPQIAADVFLKDVQRQGNHIVFTVGIKADASQDNTFSIDIADLAPVQTDGITIVGNGTNVDNLRVQLSQTVAIDGANLLKLAGDGLYVSETDITDLIAAKAPTKEPRDIRLVNASGQTVIGYIHSTEQ
jgi:hypothetical protein